MLEKSGQMGVPVIIAEGQIIVGFNKPKIVEILGIKEQYHSNRIVINTIEYLSILWYNYFMGKTKTSEK